VSRIAAFLYGTIAYLVFLGTIFYAIGFIGGMVVPKTIDSGPVVHWAKRSESMCC
jgi:dolichol kinase